MPRPPDGTFAEALPAVPPSAAGPPAAAQSRRVALDLRSKLGSPATPFNTSLDG